MGVGGEGWEIGWLGCGGGETLGECRVWAGFGALAVVVFVGTENTVDKSMNLNGSCGCWVWVIWGSVVDGRHVRIGDCEELKWV